MKIAIPNAPGWIGYYEQGKLTYEAGMPCVVPVNLEYDSLLYNAWISGYYSYQKRV